MAKVGGGALPCLHGHLIPSFVLLLGGESCGQVGNIPFFFGRGGRKQP